MDLPRDELTETPAGAPAAAPASAPASPVTGLPASVASWLQRVDAAAHPRPRLCVDVKDPKLAQYKFV